MEGNLRIPLQTLAHPNRNAPRLDNPVPSSLGPHSDQPQVAAVSGSSNLIALRGRHLHLAGSYESDGFWVGAYVDDKDLQLVRHRLRQEDAED